jgi:hypothetical protein
MKTLTGNNDHILYNKETVSEVTLTLLPEQCWLVSVSSIEAVLRILKNLTDSDPKNLDSDPDPDPARCKVLY